MKKISTLSILGLLLLSATSGSIQVSGAGFTRLRIDPYLSTATVGEDFNVTVKVENVQDLYAWQVVMSFDPAVLEVVGGTYGDFLATQPQGTYQAPPVLNNTYGWTGFGETTLGRPPGVDGSGILATVTFNVRTSGESFLNITDPVPVTATYNATCILLDSTWPEPQDIPFTPLDGYFNNLPSAWVNIAITPTPVTAGLGETFTIDINVVNVTNLWAFDIKIKWQSGLLNCTDIQEGPFLKSGGTTFFTSAINNDEVPPNLLAGALLIGGTPQNGSGVLASATFEVLDIGGSTLDLFDTMLTDQSLTPIEHGGIDGYFSAVAAYTLSISVVGSGTTDPAVGDHVYDEGTMVVVDAIPDAGWMLDHWNLDGVDVGEADSYTLRMYDDHVLTAVFVEAIHDVAVVDVDIEQSVVQPGQQVNVHVLVANEGTCTETFDVTVYYNATVVGTTTVSSLKPGWSDWVWVMWDTTGVAEGTYTISAEASIVPGETDTVDNVCINGDVTIKVPKIAISPSSGPVGTKVTVQGSGFVSVAPGYLMFDDELVGFIFPSMYSDFNLTFNVPLSEAGPHVIKAVWMYYYDSPVLEATFTVIDKAPLDIEMDVGTLHFKGETAEFYVKTAFRGTSVNVTYIEALLHKPDGINEILSVQHVAAGLYKIAYSITGKGSTHGTYTLEVNASYVADWITSTGTSLKTFLVKPPGKEFKHEAPKLAVSIATIASALGLILVYRREEQNHV